MQFFVALLIFVLVYAVVKFLLEKVPPVASLSEIVALVGAALAALLYVGAIG